MELYQKSLLNYQLEKIFLTFNRYNGPQLMNTEYSPDLDIYFKI
ncbi:hypothetical protein An18g00250 [Aspergillus niger]|uniref:Uncharacterized protein n=2 Tax=Aspergillus niger TaxID=5061 RepID=A2R9U5_ASPNC|nr:hypothetical protein An18g00250 [Aspergillus niger]CAK43101.1 hypothetical protein An18g00250 [Aspergillus niger]